jgi:hypothetical protein
MRGVWLIPLYFAAIVLAPITVDAQWLQHRSPGTPRTADGKPDLSAPTPRLSNGKPDLSGIWYPVSVGYLRNIMADMRPEDVPFQPRASAMYESRMVKDDPAARCMPLGIPRSLNSMFKIVHTPGIVLVLYENHKHYREIFVDGRSLPVDPNPSWFGYSIGRWEAEVFVVESVGFNDEAWLDYFGHPQSKSLRVTERYSRTDVGHMDVQVTIDDAGAYTRPFTVNYPLALAPDTELIETICENNGQILARLVGTDLAHPPTKKSIAVDPEVLRRYGGTYELAPGRDIVVTPGRDRLMMKFPGNGDTLTMFAEAVNRFFLTTRDEIIEFQSDGDRPARGLVIYSGTSRQVAPRTSP